MLDDEFKEVKLSRSIFVQNRQCSAQAPGTDKVVFEDGDDCPAEVDGLAVVYATDTLAQPKNFSHACVDNKVCLQKIFFVYLKDSLKRVETFMKK